MPELDETCVTGDRIFMLLVAGDLFIIRKGTKNVNICFYCMNLCILILYV